MTGSQSGGEMGSNSCGSLPPEASRNPVQSPSDSTIRISNNNGLKSSHPRLENDGIGFNQPSSSQLDPSNEHGDIDSDVDLFKVPEDIGERLAPFFRQNELQNAWIGPEYDYLQNANKSWSEKADRDEPVFRKSNGKIKGMTSIKLQNPYTITRKSLFIGLPTVGDILRQKRAKPRNLQEEWVKNPGKELLRLEKQDKYTQQMSLLNPT